MRLRHHSLSYFLSLFPLLRAYKVYSHQATTSNAMEPKDKRESRTTTFEDTMVYPEASPKVSEGSVPSSVSTPVKFSQYLLRYLKRLSNPRRLHSNHRQILGGMASVAFCLIIAKLIGLLKEMLTASRYGVSGVVDAYVLVFSIVTWLPSVFRSIGEWLFVPRLVSLSNKPSQREAFLNEINSLSLLLGLFAMLVVLSAGFIIVDLLTVDWSQEAQGLAQLMVWQFAPLGLLITFSAFIAIRLQASREPTYTLWEVMPSFGVAVFLLIGIAPQDPRPLVWGTLIGAIVQVFILLGIAKARGVLGKALPLNFSSERWQPIYQSLGILLMGQVLLTLSIPIDNAFASRLGEGAIAKLSYANRLISLFTAMGATMIGRALLPVLSESVARKEIALARRHSLQWTATIWVICALAVLIGWLIAPALTTWVFQWGAFTSADAEQVATLFRLALLQLPFYCAVVAFAQWFAAIKRYDIIPKSAFISFFVKIVLNYLLVQPFGIIGIPIATVALYVCFSALCFFQFLKINSEKV